MVVGRHFRASSSRIHIDAKSPIIGGIAESVSKNVGYLLERKSSIASNELLQVPISGRTGAGAGD
jgi:hypothetical protein